MGEALNDDNRVYVAVSKDVRESRLSLIWALRNLRVNKIFIVHIHQQISISSTLSDLEHSEIDAIQASEFTTTFESLQKYRDICENEGVMEQDVDILCHLANNVEEGIVELIYANNIKKLIMGAATDSQARKAEYVSGHVPHSCKIWLLRNGKLIRTREGRFDLEVPSYSSSSESLTSLDSALTPYNEEAGRAELDTESHPLSLPEDPPEARGLETKYYEELRQSLENEELNRGKKEHDKMKSERDEEVSRRREVEEELKKAKEEIENMKNVQKELQEQLYIDCPRIIDLFQKERDEAIKTNEELQLLMRLVNSDKGASSSSSSLQWSLSNEPPPYFICPISKEIMRNPHVAADGYTYEREEFRSWLNHGGEKSPMTNLKLDNHSLTPNLVLRSAINDWLQLHPYYYDMP